MRFENWADSTVCSLVKRVTRTPISMSVRGDIKGGVSKGAIFACPSPEGWVLVWGGCPYSTGLQITS